MEDQNVLVIAGLVATVVSLVVSWLWRWLDGRRANWQTFDSISEWTFTNDPDVRTTNGPGLVCSLANTGDGDAFAVIVSGYGCTAQLLPESPRSFEARGAEVHTTPLLPRVASGETVGLMVGCGLELWNVAEVKITWTASPTRMGRFARRTRVIRVNEIGGPPQPMELVSAAHYEDGGEPIGAPPVEPRVVRVGVTPGGPQPVEPMVRQDLPFNSSRWRAMLRRIRAPRTRVERE